jgi:hypothetical protein
MIQALVFNAPAFLRQQISASLAMPAYTRSPGRFHQNPSARPRIASAAALVKDDEPSRVGWFRQMANLDHWYCVHLTWAHSAVAFSSGGSWAMHLHLPDLADRQRGFRPGGVVTLTMD